MYKPWEKFNQKSKNKMVEKAIILAGGKGERLRPLTEKVPKPLLPFQGKLMIDHVFDTIKQGGIKQALLTLGYLPDKFKEILGNERMGLQLSYVTEHEPLGTAGFLNLNSITEPVLTINSDSIFKNDFSVQDFSTVHKEFVNQGGVATIALSEVEDTTGLGTVKVEENKITSFDEKANTSNLINAGWYLLEPTIMDYLPENQKKIMFERDLFPQLAKQGKLFAYRTNAKWIHIRDLEAYDKLKE